MIEDALRELVREVVNEELNRREPRLDRPSYTIRETAKFLRVSERTLSRWIADKKVETLRTGRSVRIPSSEIKRLLRETG